MHYTLTTKLQIKATLLFYGFALLAIFQLTTCDSLLSHQSPQQTKTQQQPFNAKPFLDESRQPLSFTLVSGDFTKSIPRNRQSSCQLVVFTFYDDKFTLTIQNLSPEIDLLDIKLQTMNLDFPRCPNINGSIMIEINTQEYKANAIEITEYFTITGYSSENDNKLWAQTIKNPIKETQQQLLLYRNNQYDNQSKNTVTNEQLVFSQTRKVYLIKCSDQQTGYVSLPEAAIILTQILAFLCILVLSRNLKYRRFTPLNFGFVFAFLYSAMLFIVMYIDQLISLINSDINIDDLHIPKYLVALWSLVCISVYSVDILNIFIEKRSVMFPIAVVFSLGILSLDLFVLVDYWYINNIIAILVSGCIIKFIVIRKLRTSILPLLILWVFSVVRQFVHLQSVSQEFALQIFPLHLQIPACFGDNQDGYSCSAFGSSKIIIMGLLVNYAIRVDLFLSTKFYEIVNLIIALICLIFELGMNYIDDDLPVLEYFSVSLYMPISNFQILLSLHIGVIAMLLFASKRGQWAVIWHGSFYDVAVNRMSIKKNISSFNSLEDNFGDGLVLNSTLSNDSR